MEGNIKCYFIIEELKSLITDLDELQIFKVEKVLVLLKDEIMFAKDLEKNKNNEFFRISHNLFDEESLFVTPKKQDGFKPSKRKKQFLVFLFNFFNLFNNYKDFIFPLINSKENSLEIDFARNNDVIDRGNILNARSEANSIFKSRKSSKNKIATELDLNENRELSKNSEISKTTCVKNYIVYYRGIKFEHIYNALKEQLKNSRYNITKKIINDPVVILHISFEKQRRLNKECSELLINGIKPFYCYSSAAFKKEKTITNTFKVEPGDKTNSIYKITWNYNRNNIKIFQGSSVNISNSENINFCNDEEDDFKNLQIEFQKLIDDFNNFNPNKFSSLLKIKIMKSLIENKNEIILSHIIYSLIEHTNKIKKEKI